MNKIAALWLAKAVAKRFVQFQFAERVDEIVATRFIPGDTAFILELNRAIREVRIIKCSGGMYLIRFTDSDGEIKVKEHRLFTIKEEAELSIPHEEEKRSRTPYDYEY